MYITFPLRGYCKSHVIHVLELDTDINKNGGTNDDSSVKFVLKWYKNPSRMTKVLLKM